MKRSVILFAAHAYSRSAFRELERIRRAVPEGSDCLLFWDRAGNARHARRIAKLARHEYDRERLPQQLSYAFYSPSGMIPGSGHFAVIQFARERAYDHYWFIEHDVRFTGDWRVVFEHFDEAEDDFTSSRMSRHEAEPDWHWWGSLSHPTEEIALGERLRSFNPIYRISRRALEHLDEMHRRGWRGHQEVLIATLLERGGFQLRDFGGRGLKVRPGDRDRYYLEPESEDGRSVWAGSGSMRWRPHHYFFGQQPRDKLFHPVSPGLLAHVKARSAALPRQYRNAP